MVIKLLKNQLAEALLKLQEKTPQSLPMWGVIRAELIAGWDWYHFIVDSWPDFTCIAAMPQEWLIKQKAENGDTTWISIFSCTSDEATVQFLHQCEISFEKPLYFPALQDNVVRCLRNMSSTQGNIRAHACYMFGLDDGASMVKEINYDGLKIDALHEGDVDFVNEKRTFGGKTKQARDFVSNLIAAFPSSCIRDKGDNSIYAHMLLSGDLSMGMLHVHESKRRLGFGSAVLQNLAAKVKDIGATPFWYVVPDNLTSVAFAERNGNKLCDDAFSWIIYKPNKV